MGLTSYSASLKFLSSIIVNITKGTVRPSRRKMGNVCKWGEGVRRVQGEWVGDDGRVCGNCKIRVWAIFDGPVGCDR